MREPPVVSSHLAFAPGYRANVHLSASASTMSIPAADPARKQDENVSFSFEELIQKERAWLDRQPAPGPGAATQGFMVSRPGVTAEPWVCFTSRDTFGVALSGGGVRSATFNLGLLQALEQRRLLGHVDYLSTVSGGGYTGGFLDAWQHHHPDATGAFPTQAERANDDPKSPVDTREPAPLRQLREFSRFLMPRLGLFHIETWGAIVTILGGLLPSLFTACAVLAAVVYTWMLLGFWLVAFPPYAGAGMIAAITLLALLGTDHRRRARGKNSADSGKTYRWLASITTLWVGAVWLVLGYKNRLPQAGVDWLKKFWPVTPADSAAAATSGFSAWLDGKFAWLEQNFNLWSAEWAVRASVDEAAGGAFAPVLAWFGIALLLLFVRGLSSRANQQRINWSGAIDRIITVCLGLGLGWGAMAVVWVGCQWLHGTESTTAGAASIGLGAAASGGLFARLRDWLNKPSEETRASTLMAKIIAMLRPQIPQILAALAVVLLLAGTCLGVQIGIKHGILLGGIVCVAVVIGTTLVFFDPARVGMHDFYRARICRCFLGSARADLGAYQRDTEERPEDDLTLEALRGPKDAKPSRHRPIHLVCCTANNLSGDVLGSLYRGGRSAVISPHGIALGNDAAPLDKLRLSSALTASAAAFNSQMGRYSIDLGPSVAFLMSALNLRLGLWVPHPLNPNRENGFFRGLPFFYEMLGLTNCEVPPGRTRHRVATATETAGEQTAPAKQPLREKVGEWVEEKRDRVYRQFCDLHLSDGGHFENLGLYELVRRHCRYIIVSDCGADPETVFDDLAVALRTIREDFGVEIDLDVSPLRKDANGRSRQHAVVGTIHYDGLSGLDKGTLVYFKPSLTGDEPPDVLQYQSRNVAFPHESTGDQFYDEAQWESYRRLGLHAGNVVFGFINQKDGRRTYQGSTVENAFLEATRLWHPTPERQSEAFLALTERCSQLEADIRENAPVALRAEFFPELAAVTRNVAGASEPTDAASRPPEGDEVRTIYYVMQIAQMMEDVWVGAELDTYWSHPMNDGWMNYCHRWAATPSFRRWWPVLRPIYSIGFRDFVRKQFDLGYNDAKPGHTAGARLTLTANTTREGLAWDYWRRRGVDPAHTADKKVLEFRLTLDPLSALPGMEDLPVGILFYRATADQTAIEWQSDHLFVPPSLNGAGITARFLEAIIGHLPQRLEVTFEQDRARTDRASRLRQLHNVNFYKSRQFICENPTDAHGKMRLVLPARVGSAPSAPGQLPGSAAQPAILVDPNIGPKLVGTALKNLPTASPAATANKR